MSLGYNVNRKHRVSTLPGSVSNVVMPHAPRRRAVEVRRTSPDATVAPSRPVAVSEPVARPTPPPPHTVDAQEHWVYATATEALRDAEGGVVLADAGDRVFMVYPMACDRDDGVVTMRLKHAHPVTGQLQHTWVAAYDPNTETRFLTSFSLVP